MAQSDRSSFTSAVLPTIASQSLDVHSSGLIAKMELEPKSALSHAFLAMDSIRALGCGFFLSFGLLQFCDTKDAVSMFPKNASL